MFREKHVAFVDDVLSGDDMVEMRRHLEACYRCARHDTGVRRSLILARNLPQIAPSADFMERLNARLRDLDRLDSGRSQRTPTVGPFAMLAASIIAIAGLATALSSRSDSTEPIVLPPVVASIPAEPPEPVASAAVVASLATGIPMWPAVFMLSHAPENLVRVELADDR